MWSVSRIRRRRGVGEGRVLVDGRGGRDIYVLSLRC